MVDIKQLENKYFSNDESVPYKLKCGVEILIHPILVKNWNDVGNALNCLTIRKNEINDVNIIQMKYLDFILMLSTRDENIMNQIRIIVKYSLKEEYAMIHSDGKRNYLAITDKDDIIKYVINGKEFDDLRTIILHQNISDYDDRYISPDVRELYDSYIKATSSKNQIDPSLERKKVFIIGKTGLSMGEINNMSYRIFNQIYIDNVNIDLYFARKIIQASQKYDVKEEPIYPLFEKQTDKYDKLFVQKDAIQNKLDKIQ